MCQNKKIKTLFYHVCIQILGRGGGEREERKEYYIDLYFCIYILGIDRERVFFVRYR